MEMENKNTFFMIDMRIPSEFKNSDSFNKELDDGVDMILYSMNASLENTYKIIKKDDTRRVILFKASTRKRKGQLNKFCKRHLSESINFTNDAISKDDLLENLKRAKESKLFNVSKLNENEENSYTGNDIKAFNDKKNWYSWQKDVYDFLYDEFGNVKEPDSRAIINLVDYKGNSGKSSFFKYLYVNDTRDSIGRASYGTASQLRSALINQGPKKIYIIDLSRARSQNDKQEDLLSILEDCKSGFLVSPMYGQSKQLIMEPPHIIVSSNYMFKTELLSSDRWNIYEIKNKTLGRKNELLQKKIEEKKSKINVKKYF